MEKVITALALFCTACGTVEGLRAEDLYGLQSRSSTSIYGLVTNARTNGAIAGATVLVAGRSALTEGDGTYRIDGLAPIDATVSVAVHGYETLSTSVKLESGANLYNLELEPNGCGRNDCRPGEFCNEGQCVEGATLTGSVFSKCSGRALDALVRIGGKAQCATAAKGAIFDLRELSPGGPQVISIGKFGYLTFTKQLTLQAGFNALDPVELTPEGGCGTDPDVPACQCTAMNCQSSP